MCFQQRFVDFVAEWWSVRRGGAGGDDDKKKAKFTLAQALRLCAGRTAHRGSRGIALPFHDHGTRRG